MKKTSIIFVTLLLGANFIAQAEELTQVQPQVQEQSSGSTPIRFSFWPNVAQWPHGINVYGLSFGFPSSYDSKNEYTAGLDLALLQSNSNAKGLQIAILNSGSKSDGVQMAMANIVEMFYGVGFGIYNEYKNSEGLHFGLINKGISSKGVQIGLINMLDNGFFPTFPLFNFSTQK